VGYHPSTPRSEFKACVGSLLLHATVSALGRQGFEPCPATTTSCTKDVRVYLLHYVKYFFYTVLIVIVIVINKCSN
jgi:hypothetical protein